MMNCNQFSQAQSRRDFLAKFSYGIGAMALGQMLSPRAEAAMAASIPHFAPKAKRVIFLFQSGGPSHLDLFDYKPGLTDQFDKDLPDSVRQGQRITGMVSGQARLAIAAIASTSSANAARAGTGSAICCRTRRRSRDDICVIRSMHTEAINHDPAITFLQTGSQLPGRPSMGAWIDYGLGSRE